MTETTNTPKKSVLREYLEIILITILVAFVIKIFVMDAYRIPTGSMENTLIAGDYILVNKFIYGPTTPRTIPLTRSEIPHIRFPGLRKPDRGDVIVFKFPGERDEIQPSDNLNYIKRVIGLPGDNIEIQNRKVYVNGDRFPKLPTQRNSSRALKPSGRNDLRIFPSGAPFNEDNYGPIYVPKRGDTLRIDLDNYLQWEIFLQRDGAVVEILADGSVKLNDDITDTYVIQRNYYFTLGDNRDNSLDSRFWGFVPEENIIGRALLIYWSWNNFEPRSFTARFRNIRSDRIGTFIR
jgi:signal peptidase I